MRRLCIISLIILVLAASNAIAWQPKAVVTGETTIKVLFFSAASITAGNSSGAGSVQIKNTGANPLQVSFGRRVAVGTWYPALPYGAVASGQPFFGLCDSLYTLASGETFLSENITSSQRPHAASVKRASGTTSFKIMWK